MRFDTEARRAERAKLDRAWRRWERFMLVALAVWALAFATWLVIVGLVIAHEATLQGRG